MKYAITCMALLYAVLFSFGQNTAIYQQANREFQDALDLYQNQQYQAAMSKFQQLLTTNLDETTAADCSYYIANAAIRLNQRGADKLMEDFVENYPTSTKRNTAFLEVAHYYFDTGKYPYALKWYQKSSTGAFTASERDKYNFNLGYSYYATNNADAAKPYLQKVLNSPTYGAQAQYYLGYIAYEQDDYAQANQRFDQINDPKVLEEKLGYYQADLSFKSGKFKEAIELAQKQLSKSDRREQSELYKIIGESYFNLKDYSNAIPNLENYKGKNGKWSNTDFYLLGYSFYKSGNYDAAIGQFNKIVGGDNPVAQNAYYHLGECYLNQNKKSEALNAFRNAASMDYSPEIAKDALLNYARLSYDIGNPYETVPEAITKYLKLYPKDEHQSELSTLLVNAFLEAKDYEGAMALLEENAAYASGEVYQKVSLYYGLELFTNNAFTKAIAAFDKSLTKQVDSNLAYRAAFWKAESLYQLNRFEEGLQAFENVKRRSGGENTHEATLIDYNLGYAHFKLRQYQQAIAYFQNAAENRYLDAASRQDALIRGGDGQFMIQNYSAALQTYQKAAQSAGSEKDYAAYQTAMCYGFLGNSQRKVADFQKFASAFPNSSLRDDALMELANTLVKLEQNEEGLEVYERLIRDFDQSKFIPQAYLRRGLIFYNQGQYEAALRNLKTVVNKFPNTAEARQAVSSAKLVYVDLGRVEDYAAWVDTLDFVEVSDAELDEATYQVAQRKYLDGKIDLAMPAFEAYLVKFPSGLHAIEAHFTLAQMYFSQEKRALALPHYVAVAEDGTNEYAEQALTRVCEIYVSENDYQNAVPFLERLEVTAQIIQNKTFAQSNLMKGYYQRKDYKNTLEYAEKVLAVPNLDNRIKADAKIMISRAALATGNASLAQRTYREVSLISKGEIGAEAWYYNAYFDHKEGKWESSNQAVQKLVKDFGPFKQWGGKGLLLMAKNYDQLGDAFQATYILESVIENFSEFEDLVVEAKAELQIIKQKESQINSSINPDGN